MTAETPAPSGIHTRVAAVDGLRGVLSLIVVAWHVCAPLHLSWLLLPADAAVYGFFVLSGYALTRSWAAGIMGFAAFVVRRIVRLWPVYALCLAAGYALAGAPVVWSEFAWFPLIRAESRPFIDPPMWSLFLEVWVIPLMPVIVWAAAGSLWRCAAVMAAALALCFVAPEFGVVPLFIAGARLAQTDWHNRFLETPVLQWLGRISYSLYLSHWLVLAAAIRLFGPVGALAALPVVFATGWLVWRFVEQPSITLSRRLGERMARVCVSHAAPVGPA